MRPHLVGLATSQGGVFTRRQAIDCGYTERELRTLTGHRGAWITVRRGVYAERVLVDTLSPDGWYLLRVRAAQLNLRHDAVLSHHSAGVVLGLPLRSADRGLVHVTRPGVTGSRTEHGVCHHLAGFSTSDLVQVDGLWVTGPPRTGVDIGRNSGFVAGTIACDAALRAGTTRTEFARAMKRMRNWPGITAARAAVEAADGGAESVGETLTRLLTLELGIGRPETQFPVRVPGFAAYADLRVGRHVIEFDGKIKYVGRQRGGLADRPAEEIVWEEKKREDRLRSLGFGVSRVIWADLFGPQRARTKQRLLREYLRTCDQYGTDVDLWREGA